MAAARLLSLTLPLATLLLNGCAAAGVYRPVRHEVRTRFDVAAALPIDLVPKRPEGGDSLPAGNTGNGA